MLIHEGNHIGDAWYFVKHDVCHCYYLTCPRTVERHTAWDIAHATSKDLINWEKHGIVLERGTEKQWDHACLATGSVVEFQGIYWMAYTGPWNAKLTQIGLAKSRDLFNWKKVEGNPIISPDGQKFSMKGRGKRTFNHWRDAKLYKRDGKTFALICATSKQAPADACGAIAICCTKDMHNWSVVGELEIEAVSQELECPQIACIDDTYVLLFSSFKDLFSEQMKQKYGKRLRQTSYYMVSDNFWGPYHFVPDFDLVPTAGLESPEAGQYANQLVYMGNQWYLLGTVWSDKGDYIADPYIVRFSKDRLNVVSP